MLACALGSAEAPGGGFSAASQGCFKASSADGRLEGSKVSSCLMRSLASSLTSFHSGSLNE